MDSPENVPAFVGYLKGELAHAINALLERTKHTVWCDGYDSPRILDAEKAIERILYIYSNPQKSGLMDSINDYPNLSSWDAFVTGKAETSTLRIPQQTIPKLPKATLSLKAQEVISYDLISQGKEPCTLIIKPDAWMKCFSELADKEPDEIRQRIVSRLREIEKQYKVNHDKPIIGAHALRLERMQKSYTPTKRGKRMLCLSLVKEMRKTFIKWYQGCITEARAWYAAWKTGESNGHPPPGMFAPGCALFSNLVPDALPA